MQRQIMKAVLGVFVLGATVAAHAADPAPTAAAPTATSPAAAAPTAAAPTGEVQPVAVPAEAAPTGATLEVSYTGVEPASGVMMVWLWTAKDGYPADGTKAASTKNVKVEGKTLTARFEGLAPGRYAISTCHDANANGKCDMNFIGIPTEGVAVSKDKFPMIGAPSFDDNALQLTTGVVNIKLPMHY